MFCPKCGGGVFDQLFGGSCSSVCVYCGHALYCTELFSGEIDPDSVPIDNPVKAGMLRRKYNKQTKGNKEKGKKRLKEYREFYKEAVRNSKNISKHLGKK